MNDQPTKEVAKERRRLRRAVIRAAMEFYDRRVETEEGSPPEVAGKLIAACKALKAYETGLPQPEDY